MGFRPLYRERNLIERFFNPLKNFQAIAVLTTNSPRRSSPAFKTTTPASATLCQTSRLGLGLLNGWMNPVE